MDTIGSMEPESLSWQQRIDDVWASTQTLSDAEVVQAITALVDERPDDDAAAAFELASAFDFIGSEIDAEPAYRRALELGLDGMMRTRAIVQLASSLRNLNRHEEGRLLLTIELDENPDPYLRDSVIAFLCLTLIDLGREREAAIMAVSALSPHLKGYRRAVDHYVSELSTPQPWPAAAEDPEASAEYSTAHAANDNAAGDSGESPAAS
jgi:hypothetical protein